MRERTPTLGLAPVLPGLMLVVVIVWALAAVLMLTGTLVNAREINDTVPIINNQVSPINKDLDNVKLAVETAKISNRIRVAAKPLVGQTDRIIEVARRIDGRVVNILQTATAINQTAKTINGSVKTINGSVSTINGSVVSINDTVSSILGNALTINRTVDSITGNVTSINARARSIFNRVGPVGARDGSIKGSVGRILTTFRRLEPVTRSIESRGGGGGVAGINRRASAGVAGVASLKSDFAPIAVQVGPGTLGAAGHSTAGPGAIHGHANSIDCAPLLNIPLIGTTRYCGQ